MDGSSRDCHKWMVGVRAVRSLYQQAHVALRNPFRMHKCVVVKRRVANTTLRTRRIPRPWIVELETDRSQWDRETTAYEDEGPS